MGLFIHNCEIDLVLRSVEFSANRTIGDCLFDGTFGGTENAGIIKADAIG